MAETPNLEDMTLTGKIRAHRIADAIKARAASYAISNADSKKRLSQLDLWNSVWRRIGRTVPYYKRLVEEGRLPEHFRCWDEFIDRMPISNRSTLKNEGKGMISTERPIDFHRITGGSTAEPIQIPAWHSEVRYTEPDMWLGRSWYGVSPASRLFLLWGHSHLLGTGIKGWINARKRMSLDRMLGYLRFSAYDLRPEILRRAALELIRFKPDYLIGYSVALDLFASANTALRDELRALSMKMAVGAAEGFPSPESEARLGDLFGCPIAMEYGSVETGLMAHTHPSGGYRVFWGTYFMEAERKLPESPNMTVRVTSLYPRCTPLVRYEIGDEIENWDHKEERVLGMESFKRVVGRCNDYVLLEDGARIHSEAFTHAVRACPVIASYQVVHSSTDLRIRYTSDIPLSGSQIAQIRERLGKIHPALRKTEFERIDRLIQTVAGKTRMVIKN